jgi:hypothetical protein
MATMNKIVLPAQHPFEGIAEKLNRSHENIKNLEAEIARFFQESDYPLLSNDNEQFIPEAVEYHSKRPVPLRFSVLSGEIIHHLRSCLDHIIWHFSDIEYRQKHVRWIDFPILKDRPSPADVFTKYERKIKGITDARILSLIERVQPYSGSVSPNSILLAIHDFDIVDKHRTLVIVASTGAFEFPIDMMQRYGTNLSENPFSAPSDFVAEFKRDGKLVPQVAFSDFVWGEPEPVVQALGGMQNAVVGIVAECSKFLARH